MSTIIIHIDRLTDEFEAKIDSKYGRDDIAKKVTDALLKAIRESEPIYAPEKKLHIGTLLDRIREYQIFMPPHTRREEIGIWMPDAVYCEIESELFMDSPIRRIFGIEVFDHYENTVVIGFKKPNPKHPPVKFDISEFYK